MAVTYSRYEFLTVSLPKRFRNGRVTYETAGRRFRSETEKRPQDPEALKKFRWDF
jgi:hypothetical protein